MEITMISSSSISPCTTSLATCWPTSTARFA
jgi:hypothetical protein